METVHGKWNLNWQLADDWLSGRISTPHFVVEYPDGFVIQGLGDSVESTMIPLRLEDNSCCYFCKENEQLYSQQDINYFFYSDEYSILPINITPTIMNSFGNEMMAEEMEEEFDIMDMLL
jgi:hypothetical protein